MNSKSIRSKFWLLLVCLISSVAVSAQGFEASGKVVDEADQQPIPGVAVVVKGTTVGTVTDFDGNFSVRAEQGQSLVFSFIGYAAVELPAATGMSVTLVSDSKELEDVVVVGYGVARKNDLTGSVTAIKPDEKNKGLVTNAQDMLSGKVAGVSVTSQSGTPGGGATIRIRGGSSLNASNDPLVVIDGLAMDNQGVKGLSNPLSMVNPQDIETFTVLKDASATAIYGSRGSNGVIIITTKKGVKGKRPQIAYAGNVSVSTKKETIDVMDGDEFRSFIKELFGEKSEAASLLGKANTDWQDEIYRVALGTDHNLTVSGGNNRLTYRVSAGYTGQEGILKTSDFKRTTVSFNLSPNFLDNHLTFNINGKGMIAKTQYANTDAIGAAVWMDPSQPVKSDDDKFANWGGYYQWLTPSNAYNDKTYKYVYNTNATKNPVALLELYNKEATSKSIIGNIEGNYKIHGFENLILHASFGFDVSSGTEDTDYPGSYADGTYSYYGYSGTDKIDKYNLSFNAYAQYLKDFNEANHFDIMAGYEYQKFHHEQDWSGQGMYPETNNDPTLAGTPYKADGKISKSENYIVSFFGRANYSLLDRYLLTATVRYDGSSRFKDHWALFPSFALGWRVKQEAFLQDVDWLRDFKVRLGYGQTGQQEGIGDYGYLATYTTSTSTNNYYPISGDGTLNRPDAVNPDLTWETTETYNVGLDMSFLNDRISFSGDYYFRKTTDLLNTVYVAAGSNFRNQVTGNIGSLENKGVELALTVRPVQTDDWQWEITANAAYNKNEITELIGDDDYYVETGGISSGTGKNIQAHKAGYAAKSFYVYQQVYDEAGKPIEGVYVDRNADGIINESDRYCYKNPAAPWTLGLASRLQWRNVDFSFSLRGSIGNYVFNDGEAGASNLSTAGVYVNNYLHNIRKDALDKNWQSWTWVQSDYFVQNASFLKCDNITLGYSFSHLFGSKLGGRVYATASNVFTITNYSGLDPEVDGGIDNNIYPRPFTGIVGLSLNF